MGITIFEKSEEVKDKENCQWFLKVNLTTKVIEAVFLIPVIPFFDLGLGIFLI